MAVELAHDDSDAMLKQLAIAFARVSSVMLPLWLAARIYLARARAGWTTRRELVLLAVVTYALVVAAVTVMPLPMTRSGMVIPVLWSPLTALMCLAPGPGAPPGALEYCTRNLFGNLALFLPLGFAMRILRAHGSARTTLVVALVLSLAIEITQYVQRAFGIFRTVDTADVILNVAGALAGYWIAGLSTRDRVNP